MSSENPYLGLGVGGGTYVRTYVCTGFIYLIIFLVSRQIVEEGVVHSDAE